MAPRGTGPLHARTPAKQFEGALRREGRPPSRMLIQVCPTDGRPDVRSKRPIDSGFSLVRMEVHYSGLAAG